MSVWPATTPSAFTLLHDDDDLVTLSAAARTFIDAFNFERRFGVPGGFGHLVLVHESRPLVAVGGVRADMGLEPRFANGDEEEKPGSGFSGTAGPSWCLDLEAIFRVVETMQSPALRASA
ncbi:hypothetical protein GALMADRAFT_147656 [Galerina marginata CBS 339.88]|uniref:Uncharacterized protein n=1 Tax=Galerina marginata (strain CBS 339.88) TaxID=685588 RepID=A0A067S7H0_GALM3|nr:hypothetical protein GALMADRAFT_147656 [Galerina marginata CBS 339.88]